MIIMYYRHSLPTVTRLSVFLPTVSDYGAGQSNEWIASFVTVSLGTNRRRAIPKLALRQPCIIVYERFHSTTYDGVLSLFDSSFHRR